MVGEKNTGGVLSLKHPSETIFKVEITHIRTPFFPVERVSGNKMVLNVEYLHYSGLPVSVKLESELEIHLHVCNLRYSVKNDKIK